MDKQPQSYAEYAGYFTPEMTQRAIDAGCKTVKEKSDWFDRTYGGSPGSEQNQFYIRTRFRRPGER